MVEDGAFHVAARREQDEELRREATTLRLRRGARSRGSLSLLAFLGWPYLLWALARAASYDWQEPVGRSLIDFLLHSGTWFAAATIVILVVIWFWLIGLARGK